MMHKSIAGTTPAGHSQPQTHLNYLLGLAFSLQKLLTYRLVWAMAATMLLTSARQPLLKETPIVTPIQKTGTSSLPPCELPAPSYFSADRTGYNTASLEWSAVQGADSYRLMVYDLSTSQLVSNTVLHGTATTLDDLDPGVSYRCALASMCTSSSTSDFIIYDDILD